MVEATVSRGHSHHEGQLQGHHISLLSPLFNVTTWRQQTRNHSPPTPAVEQVCEWWQRGGNRDYGLKLRPLRYVKYGLGVPSRGCCELMPNQVMPSSPAFRGPSFLPCSNPF